MIKAGALICVIEAEIVKVIKAIKLKFLKISPAQKCPSPAFLLLIEKLRRLRFCLGL